MVCSECFRVMLLGFWQPFSLAQRNNWQFSTAHELLCLMFVLFKAPTSVWVHNCLMFIFGDVHSVWSILVPQHLLRMQQLQFLEKLGLVQQLESWLYALNFICILITLWKFMQRYRLLFIHSKFMEGSFCISWLGTH